MGMFSGFMREVGMTIFNNPASVGIFVAIVMLYIIFTALHAAAEGAGIPIPRWLKFGNTFVDSLLRTIFSAPKKLMGMMKGGKK